MKTAVGCLLIMLSGFYVRRELCSYHRQEQYALRDVSVALEYLADEISSRRVPMTRILTMSGMGRYADMLFLRVRSGMSRGKTLPDAWKEAAEQLPLLDRERRAVAMLSVQFSAQQEDLCRGVMQVAELLKKKECQTEERRQGQEKIIAVSCLSGSALLCILLL